MLRVLAKTAQLGFLSLAAYNTVVALWGWKNRTPAAAGPRSRRLRVVVPAHNEEATITAVVEEFRGSPYLDEILVVASKVKAYIKARSGMNTSGSVMDELSDHVRKICDKAIKSAAQHERKTVLDRDVP